MKLKRNFCWSLSWQIYYYYKEFNILTAENFTVKLAQANLANKTDIANFVKKPDLNKNELSELSKNWKQQKD